MEAAHSPPAKIARFAETGLMMMMGGRESSEKLPSIALDLGLGSTGFTHGKSVFTYLQLKELEHQALIFKHMAAGVPVPFHLVLPIWKSLANSYDAIHGSSGIYPSFLGCKGVYFDYRNSMEPEPGRCRRTDGKKWRCSKDVVPDQKYCERHMHRGRNRSRKPVETTISSSSSQVQMVHTSSSSNLTNDSNTNLSISIPLQLMTTANTSTATSITTTATTTTNATNNITEMSPRLGFSPKSVLLQRGRGGTCKTE